MDYEINNIELNAILYYADFLSLLAISIPVTDNCKYFYVHGTPINSCYILDLEPIYDPQNVYFLLAKEEYTVLRDKFGEEGVLSFIDNIVNLGVCGAVGAELMLKCIHHYGNKHDRKLAFKTYNNWKNNKKYYHILTDEDGREIEQECSMYTYHVERSLEKRGFPQSSGPHSSKCEIHAIESLL